jgi:Squalene/phytoene synthase
MNMPSMMMRERCHRKRSEVVKSNQPWQRLDGRVSLEVGLADRSPDKKPDQVSAKQASAKQASGEADRIAVSDRALFYQTHLDRVSRSFAFCIARLEGELREQVGLAYLLCRILDTIEDATWPSFAEQDRAFSKFNSFIESRPETEELKGWMTSFPMDIPEGEAILLCDAGRVFSDFHELSPSLRTSLGRLVLSMSHGMRFFMEKKSRVGKLILATPSEVNRYCFFVAGVVGEMLVRFLEAKDQAFAKEPRRLLSAFRFGLFLQKVNILKDQAGDEVLGRNLVPSRSLVLASLLRDAESAFEFLRNLPVAEEGFRIFCAWSLFLGLASLPFIQNSHEAVSKSEQPIKISRDETLLLLNEIEDRIADNQSLKELFDEFYEHGLTLQSAKRQSTQDKEAQAQSVSDDVDQAESKNLLALYFGELAAPDVLGIFNQPARI